MNIPELMVGQTLAAALQWCYWKTPEVRWRQYWTIHLGQHLADAIMAVVLYLAWGLDLVKSFAAMVGEEERFSKLPSLPTKEGASVVVGFALAFVVRFLYPKLKRLIKKAEEE